VLKEKFLNQHLHLLSTATQYGVISNPQLGSRQEELLAHSMLVIWDSELGLIPRYRSGPEPVFFIFLDLAAT
jgi:hypothetical protein